MSADYTISDKLVQIMYILSGLFCMYCGVRAWMVKANKHYIPTGCFWFALGIVVAFGQWLPAIASGIIVAIVSVPAALSMVKRGNLESATKEEQQKNFKKIGMKIFIPALTVAVCSLLFALFTNISSMVGVTVGVIISMIILRAYSSDNKPQVFLEGSERFLSMMGPLCMLPQLLGALGGIFTAAGVGEVIAGIVENVVPSTKRKCQPWYHHFRNRNGALHHDHGKCFRGYHGYYRWYRRTIRTCVRCGSGYHRNACSDMRLLWYTLYTNGCELQHRSGGYSEYERPLGCY